MLRLFKRGWGARLPALLAAGTLGLATPAWAAPPAAAAAARGGERVGLTCEPGRLQEIKVELSWLGDRSTFSCPLLARARGSRLEVSGEVPTEAVHEQALKLARQSTALTVVDAIQLQPSLGTPPDAAAPEELVPSVMQVVRSYLGDSAAAVEVGTRAGGQIVLRGTIRSWQEKLAVSSRLREIRGCTCVVNLLGVTAAQPESRPAAKPVPATQVVPHVMPRIQEAGESTVPLPLPSLLPAAPAAPKSTPPAMPRAVGKGPESVTAPAWLPVSAREDVGPALEAVAVPMTQPGNVIAIADPGKVQSAPVAISSQSASPSPYNAASGMPELVEVPASPSVSPYGAVSAPAPQTVAPVSPSRAAPATAKRFAEFVPEKPLPRIGVPTRDWPAPTARETRKVEPPKSTSWWGSWFGSSEKAAPSPRTGWLSGSRPQPMSVRVQSKATPLVSKVALTVPDKPYVTTGTIVFHDAAARPVSAVTRVAAPAPRTPEQLRLRVLAACGGAVREVRVQPRADNGLQVTVKVPSGSSEKDVSLRILQLPEMAAADVHLSLEVAP